MKASSIQAPVSLLLYAKEIRLSAGILASCRLTDAKPMIISGGLLSRAMLVAELGKPR